MTTTAEVRKALEEAKSALCRNAPGAWETEKPICDHINAILARDDWAVVPRVGRTSKSSIGILFPIRHNR